MNINVTGNYNLVLTPEAFILNTANIYLQCQTAGANPPVVINLPRITTIEGITTTWGFKVFINDAGNNASIKTITLVPHPADRINGGALGAPIILNTNGATGILQVTGTNVWEFSLGSSSSGGGSGFDIWSGDNLGITTGEEDPITIFYGTPFLFTSPQNTESRTYKYLGLKTLTAKNLIIQVGSDLYTVPVVITVRKNLADTTLVITVPPLTPTGIIILNIIDSFIINTNDLITIKFDATGALSGTLVLDYLTFQVDYLT